MNPQKNRKRENSKGRGMRRNKTAVLLVLFCLCIGGIAMISAKYINQKKTDNNTVTAKGFYFESDLLDGKEHTVIPTDSKNTASVTVRLKNFEDDLRYSETDVDYTVSVAEGDTNVAATDVTVKNADGKATGTIATGAKNYADVTLSNLKAGKTYKITATTDNVYKKTLTGTIKVADSDNDVYASVNDENQYIEVTVWTIDYNGEVKLSYHDEDLIPDNTNKEMKDAVSGSGKKTITFSKWGANTSHVFRFFKNVENKTYQVSVNDKEVTVSAK